MTPSIFLVKSIIRFNREFNTHLREKNLIDEEIKLFYYYVRG